MEMGFTELERYIVFCSVVGRFMMLTVYKVVLKFSPKMQINLVLINSSAYIRKAVCKKFSCVDDDVNDTFIYVYIYLFKERYR